MAVREKMRKVNPRTSTCRAGTFYELHNVIIGTHMQLRWHKFIRYWLMQNTRFR